MKDTCKPGARATSRVTVDETRSTRHMGESLSVYGTPSMVRDIEHLCHDLLAQHLDPGEGSVGTRVDIRHLAPTPAGMWAEITAEITKVDGRKVTFEAVVRDAHDEVGRCTPERFVADLGRLKERLNSKIARNRGAS